MVYRWKTDVPAQWGRAQRVGEALDAISRDNGGTLHPQDVVAAARAPESVLHSLFEWDDRKAARQHRLDQATRMIAAIVIPVHTEEHAAVRAVYGQGEAESQGHIVAHDSRSLAKARVRGQLLAAIRQYKRVADPDEICELLRAELQQLEALAGV